MQSLRAFGYDISTAIADLIDNSITANAKEIDIKFEWNNDEPWIFIMDNGIGMTEEVLSKAMKPGSQNPLEIREENDLGRFGLGLKTASFSQCRRVTVITKACEHEACVRCWDLDIVNEENSWILLKDGSNTAKLLQEQYIDHMASGTIVLWEKIDRIIPGAHINDEAYQKAFLNYAKDVKQHIAVVFSTYMSGKDKIEFRLNDNPIKLWDPFMADNSFTTKMPTETLYVNGYEVKIRPFILPHQSNLTNEEFALGAGIHGWTEQQGFYIYRNNRLIVMGDWLLHGMEKKEQFRLARVRIDIGNKMDSEWGIDVRKSVAVPPISIQSEIKRIAIAVQKASSKVFGHRGKKIARSAKKEHAYMWHQIVRSGKLGYSINREHPLVKSMLNNDQTNEIAKLIDLIEETIPVPMIISDYSEKSEEMLNPFEGKGTDEFDDMIGKVYNYYLGMGCTPKEAISYVANAEPFIYSPEKVELYCEREGIEIG